MRRPLLVLLVLLAAGCAPNPAPGVEASTTVRLLIAGSVDLTGAAAAVARADPDGLFREVRLAARRVDVAVVAAVRGDADQLLATAGFDLVACPEPTTLVLPEPAAPRVMLRCVAGSELGAGARRGGATVVVSTAAPPGSRADVVVAAGGERLAAAVIPPALGRPRLAVSGLGVLLSGEADAGGMLEVLADEEGVIAFRLGRTTHADLRVHFAGWDLPAGDAVLLDGEWWALARPVRPAAPAPLPDLGGFAFGDLAAAAVGDITGDGAPDLAASYRHPFRPTALTEQWPGSVPVDSLGRSAHLGVFTLAGEALWAAGLIPRPVGALAACDGALALAYTGLDDPAVVAAGAAVWQGLMLRPAPELPGPGTPGCADVDGDGALDPVILGRTP